MSKCYYLEYDLKDSSAHIIITCINAGNESKLPEHEYFKKYFPEQSVTVRDMFNTVSVEGDYADVAEANLPTLGDVIWSTASESQSRVIGYCVTHDKDGNFSEAAFKAAMKSVSDMAEEMDAKFVGMMKLGCTTNDEWFDRVNIIEDTLGDVRPVVCIQTNKELMSILDRLENLSVITRRQEA